MYITLQFSDEPLEEERQESLETHDTTLSLYSGQNTVGVYIIEYVSDHLLLVDSVIAPLSGIMFFLLNCSYYCIKQM